MDGRVPITRPQQAPFVDSPPGADSDKVIEPDKILSQEAFVVGVFFLFLF